MGRLTTAEAAKRLGIPVQTLRLMLQAGKYPFGSAVKSRQWIYVIDENRLEIYLQGKDMSKGVSA